MSPKIPPQQDPRIAPKEMIVTRRKSALQKRQLRDKDRSMTAITQLLKPPTRNQQNTKKQKLPSKQKSPKKKPSPIIEKLTPKTIERRPRLTKDKVWLKHRHNFKTVAKTNKRKLCSPHRELPPSTSPPLSPAPSEQNDSTSLCDEDLMEILTCPSPVWWEDPPDDSYSEEPIFIRSPSPQMEVEPAIKNITIKKQDVKFLNKRKKLENLMTNIKNMKNIDNVADRDVSKIDGNIIDNNNIGDGKIDNAKIDYGEHFDDENIDVDNVADKDDSKNDGNIIDNNNIDGKIDNAKIDDENMDVDHVADKDVSKNDGNIIDNNNIDGKIHNAEIDYRENIGEHVDDENMDVDHVADKDVSKNDGNIIDNNNMNDGKIDNAKMDYGENIDGENFDDENIDIDHVADKDVSKIDGNIIDNNNIDDGKIDNDKIDDGKNIDRENVDDDNIDGDTIPGEKIDGQNSNGDKIDDENIDSDNIDGDLLNDEMLLNLENMDIPIEPSVSVEKEDVMDEIPKNVDHNESAQIGNAIPENLPPLQRNPMHSIANNVTYPTFSNNKDITQVINTDLDRNENKKSPVLNIKETKDLDTISDTNIKFIDKVEDKELDETAQIILDKIKKFFREKEKKTKKEYITVYKIVDNEDKQEVKSDDQSKINYFYKKCKNVKKKTDNNKSENKTLPLPNSEVKYCFKCSSIFETKECQYCVMSATKECACDQSRGNCSDYKCDKCDLKRSCSK